MEIWGLKTNTIHINKTKNIGIYVCKDKSAEKIKREKGDFETEESITINTFRATV